MISFSFYLFFRYCSNPFIFFLSYLLLYFDFLMLSYLLSVLSLNLSTISYLNSSSLPLHISNPLINISSLYSLLFFQFPLPISCSHLFISFINIISFIYPRYFFSQISSSTVNSFFSVFFNSI